MCNLNLMCNASPQRPPLLVFTFCKTGPHTRVDSTQQRSRVIGDDSVDGRFVQEFPHHGRRSRSTRIPSSRRRAPPPGWKHLPSRGALPRLQPRQGDRACPALQACPEMSRSSQQIPQPERGPGTGCGGFHRPTWPRARSSCSLSHRLAPTLPFPCFSAPPARRARPL